MFTAWFPPRIKRSVWISDFPEKSFGMSASAKFKFRIWKKIRKPNCSKFGKRLISSCSTIFVRQLKAVVVVVGVSVSVVVVIVVVVVVVVVVVAVVAFVVAERIKI